MTGNLGPPCALSASDSMDPLTTAAASGMQARLDSLDLLANNLANTSTSGFKADREFYNTYLSAEALNNNDPAVGDSPVVQRHWTDFAQGSIANTGNQTDLALSGRGFFVVGGPNGTLYTRNGSFQVSPQGTLSTGEGYPVQLNNGQALTLDPGAAITVAPDGTVSQNGAPLGQLQLVDFPDQSQLQKAVGTNFENPDPQNIVPQAATNVQVAQGKLESSNASPAESAARMVVLLRHFEMLEKAVKIGTEMNREALERSG